MAKLTKEGYGQIELNQVAFRRDGRVEAQCKLDDTDFATAMAENGMLLAVDNVTRTVKFAKDDSLPIALNYSAEHIYDERTPGLKNFALGKDDVLPRLGYLSVGDKFTTNTVDLNGVAEDAVVGKSAGAGADGYIKIFSTGAPTFGPVLKAIAKTTMPDGQAAYKFQCIKD